jgi:hypothetical protein
VKQVTIQIPNETIRIAGNTFRFTPNVVLKSGSQGDHEIDHLRLHLNDHLPHEAIAEINTQQPGIQAHLTAIAIYPESPIFPDAARCCLNRETKRYSGSVNRMEHFSHRIGMNIQQGYALHQRLSTISAAKITQLELELIKITKSRNRIARRSGQSDRER